MNPVAITFINPKKEYWPSLGIEPVTCSQVPYLGFEKQWEKGKALVSHNTYFFFFSQSL